MIIFYFEHQLTDFLFIINIKCKIDFRLFCFWPNQSLNTL